MGAVRFCDPSHLDRIRVAEHRRQLLLQVAREERFAIIAATDTATGAETPPHANSEMVSARPASIRSAPRAAARSLHVASAWPTNNLVDAAAAISRVIQNNASSAVAGGRPNAPSRSRVGMLSVGRPGAGRPGVGQPDVVRPMRVGTYEAAQEHWAVPPDRSRQVSHAQLCI
jgi:hypothetical protein